MASRLLGEITSLVADLLGKSTDSVFDDEGRELKLGALMEGGVLAGIAYDLSDENVPIVARFRLTAELVED